VTASDELRSAVEALHQRLDAWHAAVEGIAAEAGGNTAEALADPRLEAAEERFDEALQDFNVAAERVLGVTEVDDVILDDDTDELPEVLVAEDYFVHFVVGADEGVDPERFQEALEIIDAAAFSILERLEEAGFDVPTFSTSRGDPAFFPDVYDDLDPELGLGPAQRLGDDDEGGDGRGAS
jgi:hypothetical protein